MNYARRPAWILVVCVAGCGGGTADTPDTQSLPAPTAGLELRPDNFECVAPPRPATSFGVTTAEAFPALPRFNQPVALLQAPGEASRWFVVERTGVVRVFDNDPGAATTAVFVDISGQVDSGPGEAGLLGMAFHPRFRTNGQVFLSYTRPGLVSTISRFTSRDGGRTLDAASEETILTVAQDFGNHNGGNIAFGPDGYLFAGFGDGGSAGDPLGRAQDTTSLLGAMLRLDVDGAAPYGIPPTNPFAGNPLCNSGFGASRTSACAEIYAWGFRNPWRWSFDRVTGDLWVGDVGQGNWEEVDLVQSGGNYGWRIREGAHCFDPSIGCSIAGLIDPVAEYDHTQGNSITGGYLYRGQAIPGLVGSYVYGDFGSGRVWGLFDDGRGGREPRELLATGFGISSFGEGLDGELYIVDFFGGRIHVMQPAGGEHSDAVPALLTQTGCVDPEDPTVPASGLIPYAPNAPSWADGTETMHWLGLPNGDTVSIGAEGDWDLPAGAIVMKRFALAGRFVETQLLMRHPDGVWAGYTYEWNDQQTEASRVRGGKRRAIDGQDWIYPSESQCLACHTAAAGRSLGLETAQLNGNLEYRSTGRTANQLATLDAILVFDAPLPDEPANLPVLPDPFDEALALDARARSYLHTNCAHCHRAGGPAGVNMDLRFGISLADTGLCDVLPQAGDLGVGDARIVAPGDPARSVLIERMRRRDVNGMPPIGSTEVDGAGVDLLVEWIARMNGCR